MEEVILLMTGIFSKSILSVLVLLSLGSGLAAQTPLKSSFSVVKAEKKKKAEPWNEHRFGKIKIRVRQVRSGNYDVRGTLPDENTVRVLAEKFFRSLEILPPSFLEKSRIRYVTFFDDLTLKKVPAGGVAAGDTIYLNTQSDVKTVFHEIFHTFDNCQINLNRKWIGLNDKNFVYTGSGFVSMKTSKFRRKKRQENLKTGKFDQDFVSRYAMSNDVEDRAETFAYMVVEGPRFLERVKQSPVLRKKMEYIIEMTEKKRILGKNFWEKYFHPEKYPASRADAGESATQSGNFSSENDSLSNE